MARTKQTARKSSGGLQTETAASRRRKEQAPVKSGGLKKRRKQLWKKEIMAEQKNWKLCCAKLPFSRYFMHDFDVHDIKTFKSFFFFNYGHKYNICK